MTEKIINLVEHARVANSELEGEALCIAVTTAIDMRRVPGLIYRSALEEFGKPSPKVKTLDCSPECFDEIKHLTDDIRESGEPDEMLPEDFLEVWGGAVWANRAVSAERG